MAQWEVGRGGRRSAKASTGLSGFHYSLLHAHTCAHTHTQTLTLSASLAYHNNTAQKTQTRREKTWTGLHRSLPTSSVPPATFNWYPPLQKPEGLVYSGSGGNRLFLPFLFSPSFSLSLLPSLFPYFFPLDCGSPCTWRGSSSSPGWLCFPHINFWPFHFQKLASLRLLLESL
jgi:hypothetical protein